MKVKDEQRSAGKSRSGLSLIESIVCNSTSAPTSVLS